MITIEARTALERHIIKQIRWLFGQLEELRNMPHDPGQLSAPPELEGAPLVPPPVAPAGPAALPETQPETHFMTDALADAQFVQWRNRHDREVR